MSVPPITITPPAMNMNMNMKRPRPWSSFGALSVLALALSSHHQAVVASVSADEEGEEARSSSALTAKLSTTGRSSRTGSGEEDAPEIPLVGLGVGNLPHARIPYILASALSAFPPSAGKKKKDREEGGWTNRSNDYRLIDTSHTTDSALEVLVGRALGRLSDAATGEVYHVMIKIWHTHLGYERTMLSVQDSLSDILAVPGLSPEGEKRRTGNIGSKAHHRRARNSSAGFPDVRIHAVIQYPRCYDTLFTSPAYLESRNFSQKHSSCRDEEDALDEATRTAAGPNYSPLLDKEHAWLRSYRALEELYHRGTLESLGITSEFEAEDLAALFDAATVGPHVYQGTLETLMTDEATVENLVRRGVHYQCHDAASVVARNKESAPRAYAALRRIGAAHGGVSPVQVVLGWLVHHRGVGVVPGTADAAHLAENSPRSVGGMPRFGPREALDIEEAVRALALGQDLNEPPPKKRAGEDVAPEWTEEVIDADGYSYRVGVGDQGDLDSNGDDSAGSEGVVATFFNTLPRNVRIFHVHPESGEQIQISHSIPPERSGRMIVNWDDVLIAYDGHGVAVRKFLVEEGNAEDGSVDFTVET